MKFRLIVAVITIAIIGLFGMVIYLAIQLKSKNKDLALTNVELQDSKAKYITLETKAREELEKCLNDGTRNSWEIASGTNTLTAYSSFRENCNTEESDCHKEDLKNAINVLLNAQGYVQMVETNGNQLFTAVPLTLDGDFVKFKTDKSVRTGAIGINDCGSSNPAKSGRIVKDEIVKVLKKCQTPGSQSVWAQIQYTN